MKKIKKGFTLIELLAVIVILSIILVIAVPAILKNINDSKKSVFQESADLIIKVIDQIIISDSLDSSNILEEEITDSYRCITLSESKSFGLNPAHYDIGYDNGSDTICSQVAYRDGKTYVRLVANATGKFAGMQPLSSPGYLPSPIECFTFDIPTAKITGYNLTNPSCSREVSIPEKINGVAVKIIGDSAFEGKQITGVEIPYGVTTIEYEAFWKNQLVDVTIPNSVTTFGDWAFQENRLTNINIPNSVTNMGEGAFFDNQLTSVTIPDSVTIIGTDSFAYNQLTSVTIPNSVTIIGDDAFSYNQLRNIVIPSNVVTISEDAFSFNQLTNVTISLGVTIIGEDAFESNKLTSVTIPSSVTIINSNAFSFNELTNITIPNSVITIGYGAFNNNQLPDSQAFIYARNLDGTENISIIVSYGGAKKSNLIIPSSVTTIEYYAFRDNEITSVTIPNSVTMIGYAAFNNNQLPDNQAFIYSRNTDGSIDNTKIVSYGGTKTSNLIIPSSVTTIGIWAFYGNSLTSVTIPNSVTTIENYAFRGNNITQGNALIDNSIGNVTIGSSVFTYNGANRNTTITPTYLR